MFGSSVGPSISAPSSVTSPEEEILYCCIVGIPSRTDEKRLASLKGLISLRISELDDLPSVGLPTMVEGRPRVQTGPLYKDP